MATKLSESSKGLILKAEADAVDKVWEDQPPRPNNPLITLGIEFSGTYPYLFVAYLNTALFVLSELKLNG